MPAGAALTMMGQSAASAAGSGLVNTGLGLLLEGHNDRRQLRQQSKLQNLQIGGTKELINYNKFKELEMWKSTSFPAQVEMLKQAGLNPGLLYGMGGGGGATVGGGAPNVSGAEAPKGGGEILGAMGMGMQLGLLNAQRKLLESQTKKNEAEAAATAGVDTDLKKTQISSLTQGIENQKAVQKLTEVETTLKELQATHDAETLADRIESVDYQLRQLKNMNLLDNATLHSKIEIVANQAFGVVLENNLKEMQINKTINEIEEIKNRILQKWRELDQNDVRLAIEQYKAEVGELGVIGGIANNAIGNLFNLFKKGGKLKK